MHELQPNDTGESVDRLTITVVGGGSRQWARNLMNDLGQCRELAGEVVLYDVNAESARQSARVGELIQNHPDAVGDWTYTAVEDLSDALDGADVVVCSTQDRPEETFKYDLDIPAEYGIYQSVGDTVGPGGVFRAMRSIPQYREIAAAVREQCPDAWVLNYTNPMTVCTRTLYEEYPDINAIGLCHEVSNNTQGHLASVAESFLDVRDVRSDEIDVNVKGINHFTWVDEARYRGTDLMQFLDDELAAHEPLPGFEPGDMADESYHVNNYLVTYDLYRRFGILPAAGDRHLAEFVPWYLDVDDPEEVHRWGIRLTPSEHRVNLWPTGEARREALLEGDETFEFEDTGEEMVDLIRALLGHGALKTNVNHPNVGQVAGLPDGAVVETNALVTADAVTPLAAGELPDQVESMVLTHVHNQETLIEAGFSGDLDLAFQAFLNDPLVTVQPDRARDLFVELVETERDYLDAWDFDADVMAD